MKTSRIIQVEMALITLALLFSGCSKENPILPDTAPRTLTINVFPVSAGYVNTSPNNASYAPGSSVQVEATAHAGYVFVGWTGDIRGYTNALTVTMNNSKRATANFINTNGMGSSFDLTNANDSMEVFSLGIDICTNDFGSYSINQNRSHVKLISDDGTVMCEYDIVMSEGVPVSAYGKFIYNNFTRNGIILDGEVELKMLFSSDASQVTCYYYGLLMFGGAVNMAMLMDFSFFYNGASVTTSGSVGINGVNHSFSTNGLIL